MLLDACVDSYITVLIENDVILIKMLYSGEIVNRIPYL